MAKTRTSKLVARLDVTAQIFEALASRPNEAPKRALYAEQAQTCRLAIEKINAQSTELQQLYAQRRAQPETVGPGLAKPRHREVIVTGDDGEEAKGTVST